MGGREAGSEVVRDNLGLVESAVVVDSDAVGQARSSTGVSIGVAFCEWGVDCNVEAAPRWEGHFYYSRLLLSSNHILTLAAEAPDTGADRQD